jgi:PAS domain S-box-containing protein
MKIDLKTAVSWPDYEHQPELQRKASLLMLVCLIGVGNLVGLGVVSINNSFFLAGIFEFAAAIIFIFHLTYLTITKNYNVASITCVYYIGILYFYLLYTGGTENSAYLWYYTYPLISCFLLGSKRGGISTLLLLGFAFIYFILDKFLPFGEVYPLSFKIRFIPSLTVVFFSSYLFQRTLERYQNKIEQNNNELSFQLSELETVKNELQKAQNVSEVRVEVRTTELLAANRKLAQQLEDQKKIEEALARERNLLETIINNLPDHIFVKNAKLQYVAVNEPLWKAQGFTSVNEVIGKMDYELFPEFRAYKFVKDDEEVRRTGKSLLNMKEKVISMDGKERWYLTTKVPVYDDSGTLVQIVGVSRDITDINTKEQALRQSEKKYKDTSMVLEALFDAIPDVLGVLDTNFEIHRYNKAGYEFMNTSPEEIENKRCYELLGNDKECSECPTAKAISTKKAFRIEKYMHSKNAWLDARAYPILDENGEVIRIIEHMQDITDHKKALAELKESEERFKTLFDFAPDAYFLTDPYGDIVDGNKAAERILGFSKNFIGKNLLDAGIFPASEKDRGLSILEKNRAIQPTGPDEFLINQEDGTVITAEISTCPVKINEEDYILGIARDITDRKHAEQTLKVSEERFRLISENTSDLISIISFSNNPKFKYVSPAYSKFLNYKPSELEGADCFQYVHPDDLKNLLPLLEKYLKKKEIAKKGKTILEFNGIIEYRFKDKKGKWHRIESTINKIKEDLLVVARDVTERRQQQEKIKVSLKEKEILLQEIHHRVKNNLQIISSLLYLQSKNVDSPAVLEHLQDSQSRVKSMALIHEKLYQSNDLANINFKDYVKSLANSLVQTYCKNRSTVGLDININDVFLSIDKAIPCGLIINELLTNSLKYAFPNINNGKINIELKSFKGTGKSKDSYHLCVSDNGIGIPADFDYNKTNSLGIKLVNNLTNQLDGVLEIENGNGTLFKIMFKG